MRIESGLLPGHVLQRTPRGATARISGTCEGTGAVLATISGTRALRGWKRKRVGSAAKGAFKAILSGLPTGGPYRIDLSIGDERLSVRDIFVGDLWLMAGQSNMQGCGNLVDACSPHRLVRCFNMDHTWSLAREPLHYLPESPDAVHHMGARQTREQARLAKKSLLKGAGVGLYFAREMIRRTGVPQGLIATAHGGTSMRQWDPAKRSLGGDSLYWSLLSSMRAVAQPIAGLLWYQGCSDAFDNDVAQYSERMRGLCAAVRKDLAQPRLPIVAVQIGRFVTDPGSEASWNSVQDQQRLLPQSIERLAVVPTVDLALDDLIHISGTGFAILAKRLAAAADMLVHGNKAEKPMLQPISARMLEGYKFGTAIEVRCENVVGELRSAGLPRGFTVIDKQGKPVDVIYKTVLAGDRIILEIQDAVPPDYRLMYGWGKNPVCTITDARGMALPVAGPLRIQNLSPIGPWFDAWRTSPLRPGEDIAGLTAPQAREIDGLTPRRWVQGGFVNLHPEWEGKSGHLYFFSDFELDEEMMLEARLGYDGPIRVWIDDHESHRDLSGKTPAAPDSSRFPLSLRAGRHKIAVVMAIDLGKAWGFYLRFRRLDGKPGAENPTVPSCLG
jgi:hypothetical protein